MSESEAKKGSFFHASVLKYKIVMEEFMNVVGIAIPTATLVAVGVYKQKIDRLVKDVEKISEKIDKITDRLSGDGSRGAPKFGTDITSAGSRNDVSTAVFRKRSGAAAAKRITNDKIKTHNARLNVKSLIRKPSKKVRSRAKQKS